MKRKRRLVFALVLALVFGALFGGVAQAAESGDLQWVRLTESAGFTQEGQGICDSIIINNKLYVLTRYEIIAYDLGTRTVLDRKAIGNDYSDVKNICPVGTKLYFYGRDADQHYVKEYDINSYELTPYFELVSPIDYQYGPYSLYIYNDELIVFYNSIGTAQGQFPKHMDVYDLADKTLKVSKNDYPMYPGSGFTQVNNQLYAIDRSLGDVYVYIPEGYSWRKIANGPYAISSRLSLAYDQNLIYAVGGARATEVHVYDVDSGEWNRLGDTPLGGREGMNWIGSAVFGGQIYSVSHDEIYAANLDGSGTVPPPIDDKLRIVMEEGERVNLTAVLTGAGERQFGWESTDSAIASVDSTGTVTANSPGTARITVTTPEGDFTDYCYVRVVPAGSIGDGDLGLAVRLLPGESFLLEAAGGEAPITWTSSDTTVATVAATTDNRIARVRGVGTGLCFVLAYDADGEQVGRMYVRVD